MGPEPAASAERWSAQASAKSTGHRPCRHERHVPAAQHDDDEAHTTGSPGAATEPPSGAGAAARIGPDRASRAWPDPSVPVTQATQPRVGVGPRARLRQVPRSYPRPGGRFRAVLYRLVGQHDHPRSRSRRERSCRPGRPRPSRGLPAGETAPRAGGSLSLTFGTGPRIRSPLDPIDREAIRDEQLSRR
jgi:hypothetical protein